MSSITRRTWSMVMTRDSGRDSSHIIASTVCSHGSRSCSPATTGTAGRPPLSWWRCPEGTTSSRGRSVLVEGEGLHRTAAYRLLDVLTPLLVRVLLQDRDEGGVVLQVEDVRGGHHAVAVGL